MHKALIDFHRSKGENSEKLTWLIVVAVTAIIVIAVKFIDLGDFGAATIKELDTWSQVTYEFAFLLGAINLTRLHYGNVSKKRPGWVYSVFSSHCNGSRCDNHFGKWVKGDVTVFVVENIANRIDSAVYALLGFYVCSAAYRSFELQECRSHPLAWSGSVTHACTSPYWGCHFPRYFKSRGMDTFST